MVAFRLTKEQQDNILDLIKEGVDNPKDINKRVKARKAKNTLLSESTPVIDGVINQYVGRDGVTREKLMSLGLKGFEKAIEKWFWIKDRKYQFILYATWFIRAEIHRHLGLPVDPEGYGKYKK